MISIKKIRLFGPPFSVIAGSFLLVMIPVVGWAQSLDDDFNFASGLVEWGFSDLALKYSETLLQKHPETKDRVNLIRAQSLIAGRKFAEAESMLSSLGTGNTKADAIRLALANAYNASGDTDKAKLIYTEFFSRFTEKPSDPDVLRFYRDAAYRYAMILERSGDLNGAIKAYDRVLTTDPEKDIVRRIKTDQSQILLKLARANTDGKRDEYAARARKLIEDIQWGGVDLWFGQSIITLANVELVYGDEAKAQKIISDYMDILKQIDALLEENGMSLALSPMAGARFMSGELHQRAAERAAEAKDDAGAVSEYAKALTEFYNVFIKYADSDSGPESGVRAQAIKDILVNQYGKSVNIDLGERANDAAATQFRLADTLYRDKKYEDAVKEYLRAANQFPELGATAKAMGNLIMSYANLGDTLMVKTLAAYIGERFSGKPDSANALLAAGKFYVDAGKADLYTELYNTYLDSFPGHERAGTILFYLATQRKKAGDEAGAAHYFERIINDYPKDQYYPRALNQVAWSYYTAGDYEKAIDGFRKLIKETEPGPDRALAQFNLADALIRLERFTEAAVELETLIGWIAPRDNQYATTEAERERVKSLLEKATFLRAQCFARITEPADQVAEFRDRSIRAFDQFVKLFEQSEFAPRALNAKGTVLLELKRFDEATKTFDELAQRFPNSAEGKNALFSLARAAMEIKQYDQGVAAFQKMMQNAPSYDADEFIRLGQMMGEAGYAKEAIEAYSEVQRKVEKLPEAERESARPMIERALYGIADAYYQNKQYEEAIQAVNELLTKYPQSGLFYDAKFLQGEAFRETGKFQQAVDVLGDVFRYASDSALINRATMTLADLQRKNGEPVEALASYQRLALLADRTDQATRGLIEQAMMASIDIGNELERYADVVKYCDDYIELFPQGQFITTIRKTRGDALLKSAAP